MQRQIKLGELVTELKNQNLKKKDFVLPARMLGMENGKIAFINNENPSLAKLLNEVGVTYEDGNKIVLNPLPIFHSNLAEKLDIPKRYYNKMIALDDKMLLDKNVSYWLAKHSGNVFLRTFIDKSERLGYARAMLSDHYNVIDNYDVLFAALEAVKDSGVNLKIEDDGCDLSESRMYVRFVNPDIEIKAPELLKNYKHPKGGGINVGDGIISGFCLTNSEVGKGSFTISPRAIILKCKNGMIFKDDSFGKIHLGTKMEQYSSINWSEETKRKNYELIISQVKDAIKKFTSEEYLSAKILQLAKYANETLDNKYDTVKNVTQHLKITEEKERSILDYFISSGDFTSLGVSQALTFHASQTDDADEAHELEVMAVEILPKIKEEFDKPIINKSLQTQMKMN